MTETISPSPTEKVSPSTARTPPKASRRSVDFEHHCCPPSPASPGAPGVLRAAVWPGSRERCGQRPCGRKQHHDDEQHAEDEVAVVGQAAQQLGQQADDDGADHDAGRGAHAAEHDRHQDERGLQEGEARRGDRRQLGGEQDARESAPDRAGDVGGELDPVGVDAHGLGGVLVLPDEPPGPAEPGAAEPRGERAPRPRRSARRCSRRRPGRRACRPSSPGMP